MTGKTQRKAPAACLPALLLTFSLLGCGYHTAGHAVQLPGRHKAGHEIPLEISFAEYQQDRKHVFIGIIRDVTERKRLDEKLRQTAKLESLGLLAGGIAHDFNNLLTGVLGNISLASDLLSETHPAWNRLRDAAEAGERAAHLTKQLLAYAGKGRFVIQPLDMSTLVRDISALVKTSISKNVQLRLDLASGSRKLLKKIVPDPVGMIGLEVKPGGIKITPDGKSYVYTYWTALGELFLMEGLK